MKTLFSLCLVGLIIAPLLPLASAHGVCTGLPPRFGRLDDVHFSSQTVQTGDTIVITGNITMMVQQDLHGYLSIHSSPSPHARWTIVSTEPNEKMINVTQFSRVPFSMTIKALQPGTYKLSPMLYLPDIGPAFSMLTGCNTEPVVKVTGEPICNAGFVPILKTEDDSSFCVKPDTAQILVERGWAKEIVPTSSLLNLANDTGTVTMDNRTYYFETPTYSHDAYLNPPQVSFHNVTFTLFPAGFRGGLPAIHCGLQGSGLGAYYWVDSTFSDNIHELLHLFAYSPSVCNLPIPSMFSNHTNPQAGLVFYDGKMKLLVSADFPSEINQVKLDCSKPIGEQMAQIDKSIDTKKAISLAYSSPEFVSKANQYGDVTYNSFFNDYLTGDPCNTIWKSIEIVFSATDKNGFARNIQVTEDINLTRVLNVTDYESGFGK